jgi:sigma-B regulation protein RsbU (phosphoserine phosphatase)
LKILVVEDDILARKIICRSLTRLSHEVVEAADGEEAWTLLQASDVRVVVSDWLMPRLDGLELCRRVRAQIGADYVYFILLTGNSASDENQRAAADAGVDDFLTKPLDPQEIWMRLRVAARILRYATQVRQLEAFLPICSYCKKIRDDKNYWQQIESYINKRTGTDFSHSVCPDCYKQFILPELERLHAPPRPEPNAERTN